LTTPLSFVTAKPANIHTEFKQLEETRVSVLHFCWIQSVLLSMCS